MKNVLFLLSFLLTINYATYAKKYFSHIYSGEFAPITVKGIVTNEQGAVLEGVTVALEDSSIMVTTNKEGRYTISAPVENATLVFSAVGFHTLYEPINGRTEINIKLKTKSAELEEVVVVGFGTQKKQSLTGAISTISASRLVTSSGPQTSTALAGKIAGVNFRQTDGRPGSGTMINIHGLGTPLYIIDGIRSNEGAFNNIDFNDIESISVLKDASAAIYGLQSGNGVVVVVTKSGKNQAKNTVSLNSYYGSKSWFRFPKPADTETYMKAYIQSDAIRGNTPTFTMDDLEAYRNGTKKGFDWYDFVVKNSAPQYYIGLNSSGSTKGGINYYMAVSRALDVNNIYNYGNFERYNAQFNVDAQVTPRLKVGARFNGRFEKDKHPGVPGSDDVWQAIFAIYRNVPTLGPYANNNPKYPQITSNVMSSNFAILNYDISGYYEDKVRAAQLAFDAEYKITDWLTLKGMGGYYMGNRFYNNQEYLYKLYSYDKATDTYPVAYELTNPFRERSVNMEGQLSGQAQLVFDKTFNEKHHVEATIVGESFQTENPGFLTWSRPPANAITYIDYNSLERYDDYRKQQTARVGFAGRFNYEYDRRYLFQFSGRYDGSWRFMPGNRWGFFPTGSAGWRISEEKFWKDKKIANAFSNLKLRASYGILGQDDLIGPFEYLSGYNYGSGGATLDGSYVIGSSPRGLPITSITWLKIKLFDVGFDFGFFNNKLSGSIDYFQRKADGLRAQRNDVLIPNEVGFSLPDENLNSDMRKGFDGSLTWRDNIKDLSYSIGANVTYTRVYNWHQYKPRFGNSIQKYRDTQWERYSGITWGLLSDGQFQSWEEIASYPVNIDGKGNTTLRPGDIKYQDVNGDKIINYLDERPIGYQKGTTPNLNFGLNASATYKGFDIAMDFTGGACQTYNVNYELNRPFWDGGNSASYILADQWHLSDITDPKSQLIPGKYPTALIGNTNHSNYWNSDFWLRNIRYIKLKNLVIGYTIPKKLVAGGNIRAYVYGQNIFSIDNIHDMNIDPEIVSESGLNYPTNRIIGVGLKLTY